MAPHPALLRPLALSSAALLFTGCAAGADTGEGADGSDGASAEGPAIVATTTWQGAFATAAGAGDVTVIVPADVQHAPEYEPAPSDLAAVAEADYVLYSPFEPFAQQITDAAGGDAETVEVELDNSPDTIAAEVTRLGELFGTSDAAEAWLSTFDEERERIAEDLAGRWPDGEAPRAVAQVYATWAAELAGAELVETYGPEQLGASDVAGLAGAEPAFVFENTHMSAGRVLPDSDTLQIGVVNYPGEDLDLVALYETNAHTIAEAFAGREAEPGAGGRGGHEGHGDGGDHGDRGDHGGGDSGE
ncbi:zinc ABC transporter substrate-binding protein [Nocardiopsis sp. EMB25]|uniref:metal ABC transporter solute-binding protein, Zn/Mn family n=1 Tax=Nocardiopsis sp. EMB25 TaxID=2835867 RepID=UPI002283CE66|nr:zinc ABC transporter substrate-binding protein [Nocardiopsis sp. EMB25]MCY9787440.1 zinc ABC transporter substrate-binding protein [Nocardiopsis sp. EMB25]